jgi:hypothetical protein
VLELGKSGSHGTERGTVVFRGAGGRELIGRWPVRPTPTAATAAV